MPILTPWCRVLLAHLTGLQLVKKFPAFHGTRRFITALTSVRHMSLSWANPIQSIYPHPTSWRSILILSTHLRLGLPSGLFPSGFPTKTSTAIMKLNVNYLYQEIHPPIKKHIFAEKQLQHYLLSVLTLPNVIRIFAFDFSAAILYLFLISDTLWHLVFRFIVPITSGHLYEFWNH